MNGKASTSQKNIGLTRRKAIVNVEGILDLNGHWDFREDPKDEGNAGEWWVHWPEHCRQILVPFCWQANFADLRSYCGIAWYHRSFDLPMQWNGRKVLLHFGAVDYFYELWVNGRYVGGHEGGYLPFAFDITDKVNVGSANEIFLRVIDVGPGFELPNFNSDEIPHGKQGWYSAVSGIWQDVWLESVGVPYVEDAFLDPDPLTGEVNIRLRLTGLSSEGTRVRVSIRASEDGTEAEEVIEVPPIGQVIFLTLSVKEPILWDIDDPYLYNLIIEVRHADAVSDRLRIPFGFRDIRYMDGRFQLNGRPLYLKGALDQDFYPMTIYTPPDEEWQRRKIMRAKDLNLNLLRVHVKMPDPQLLDWADRLGILIWEEVPHWERSTANSKLRAEETLTGMVLRDYNHPCIVVWGIANEGWGIKFTEGEDRNWLKSMFGLVRSLDRSRLVVDNSACPGNYHLKSDILDYHHYSSIPDHCESFVRFCESFSRDPSFAKGEGHELTGEEPLIVSEFGNWGLPDFAGIRELYKGEPEWVGTGWASGRPQGFEGRYKDWGLSDSFGPLENFYTKYQEHQVLSCKYETATMRTYSNIVGYVFTEICDTNWECNGLLDIFQRPKSGTEGMKAMNADLRVDIDPKRVVFWSGEEATIKVRIFNESKVDISRGRLEWEIKGTNCAGVIDSSRMFHDGYTHAVELKFIAPEVRRATPFTLGVSVVGEGGRLSDDVVVIWAYPQLQFPQLEQEVLLFEHIDPSSLAKAVGKRSLFLLDQLEDVAFPKETGISLINRGGDWISNLNFLRPGPHLGELRLGNPLGWECWRIIPSLIFDGIGPENSKDVLGGYLEGWVANVKPNTILARIGEGIALLTTLKLAKAYGSDPIATHLLHSFMMYTSKADVEPSIQFLRL